MVLPAAPLKTHFNKHRRPFGEPVAYPKPHPRFEPPPFTNLQNLVLGLEAVIPEDMPRIASAKKLVFHALGDSGGIHGTVAEESIAAALEAQVSTAAVQDRPAFLYHLGDVVYFNGQTTLYGYEFYEPFQYYPAPIFAIPGNHDGDTQVRQGDPVLTERTLTGFMLNFCDSQPRHRSPYRPTMTQPYVYWTLEAPFLTIIGLYSNVDGSLDGRGTNEQQRWLRAQMAAAPKDKCLIVTVHHPPFSLDDTHGGSPAILDALDRAASSANRAPDLVLSGHVHNYQRFTRRLGGVMTPYIIQGAGGYAHDRASMHKLQRGAGGQIRPPFKTTRADVILDAYNEDDPGFLRITVDSSKLVCEYFLVPFDSPPSGQPFDSISVDWRSHTLSSSKGPGSGPARKGGSR